MRKFIHHNLIPERVKAKRTSYRKAKYFINACFVTGIFTLIYSLVASYIGLKEPMYAMLSATFGFWLFPFVFSKGLRFIIACNLYIFLGTSILTYTAFYTGGFHSPILFWFALVPLAGLLMVNKVSTYIWSFIALVNIAYFGIMDARGVVFTNQIPPHYAGYVTILCGSVLILIILLLALVFEDMSSRAFNELKRKNQIITDEKSKSDKLLLNILPSEVATELKEKGSTKAQQFNEVTIMFTDFVNFTKTAEFLSPEELVNELHICFTAFDKIMEKHQLEKIKTIGDAYLAVSGLPAKDEHHAQRAIAAAIDIQNYIKMRREENPNYFDIRIGLHTGSVVAGIVGLKKFVYDIWGDSVNIAARMEQKSEPGKINISHDTYLLVQNEYECNYRGELDAKNKGKLKMYFVEQPCEVLINEVY